MSWSKVLGFYLVAVFLTMHLTGIAKNLESQGAETVASNEPFVVAVPERIDRIRMEEGETTVDFERRDGRWVVTQPEGLAPPGDVVDALIDAFASLPAIEIVSDGIEHDGQFGLVPPRARVRLEQEGALISTVVLGELSPTRTAVYAKKSGSDEVALIGLNARYYMDLIFENVRRQTRSSGASEPAGKVEPVPVEDPENLTE